MAWTKRLFIALALIAAGFVQASAQAPRKVALIIANANYGSDTLPNPTVDARLVKAALEGAGFVVQQRDDLANGEMRSVLADFQEKAEGAAVALIYYAGHGMEAGRKNWLIPTDARLTTDAQLELSTVDADVLIYSTNGAAARIVVLDACRNNPFARNMRATGRYRFAPDSKGLSGLDVQRQSGILVMFSAASGELADDGVRGEGSPFARAFAQHIAEDGVELSLAARRISGSVSNATNEEQLPFSSTSDLGGNPIYLGRPPVATLETAALQRRAEESERQLAAALRELASLKGAGTTPVARGPSRAVVAPSQTSPLPSSSACGQPDFGGRASVLEGFQDEQLLEIARNCRAYANDPRRTVRESLFANFFAGKALRMVGDLEGAETALRAVGKYEPTESSRRDVHLEMARIETQLLLAKVYAAQPGRKSEAIAAAEGTLEEYMKLWRPQSGQGVPAQLLWVVDGRLSAALTLAESHALAPRDDQRVLATLAGTFLDRSLGRRPLAVIGRQQMAELAVKLGQQYQREGTAESLENAVVLFDLAARARSIRDDPSRELFLLGVALMAGAGLAGPDEVGGCEKTTALSIQVVRVQSALQAFRSTRKQEGQTLRWSGCALMALNQLDEAVAAFSASGDSDLATRAAALRSNRQ